MPKQFIQIGRYGNLLLFLFLEVLAFYLVINFNNKQRSIFAHSSSLYTAEINDKFKQMKNYLHLTEINDSLSHSNARLHSRLSNILETRPLMDSLITPVDLKKYNYTSAEIISYTTSLRNNTMVINKGKSSGLDDGMAVLGEDGIIGVTMRCTEHFCSVLPIIHSQARISARILSCECFGNLTWTSSNPNILQLNAIPKHVKISVGDSVVTSGFSHIFPPNIFVGTVYSAFIPSGSNFYKIQVKTNNDFYSLHYVYVVKNLMHKELDSLMNNAIEDEG